MSIEDHPHSGRLSTNLTDGMSKKFDKKSTRIVGTQLTRSQKL